MPIPDTESAFAVVETAEGPFADLHDYSSYLVELLAHIAVTRTDLLSQHLNHQEASALYPWQGPNTRSVFLTPHIHTSRESAANIRALLATLKWDVVSELT
jgi:hypothetical protein